MVPPVPSSNPKRLFSPNVAASKSTQSPESPFPALYWNVEAPSSALLPPVTVKVCSPAASSRSVTSRGDEGCKFVNCVATALLSIVTTPPLLKSALNLKDMNVGSASVNLDT